MTHEPAPENEAAGHRRGTMHRLRRDRQGSWEAACEPAPLGVRAGSSRSLQKLSPSLQHSRGVPSPTKAPIITSRPRAPRMTHSLVHATGRAFRRAEGVEGDLKAICLSGGEGP